MARTSPVAGAVRRKHRVEEAPLRPSVSQHTHACTKARGTQTYIRRHAHRHTCVYTNGVSHTYIAIHFPHTDTCTHYVCGGCMRAHTYVTAPYTIRVQRRAHVYNYVHIMRTKLHPFRVYHIVHILRATMMSFYDQSRMRPAYSISYKASHCTRDVSYTSRTQHRIVSFTAQYKATYLWFHLYSKH